MPEVLPHRYAVLPVGDLSPHPENPNVGDTDAIAASIEALGFYGVVLVHESSGHILAGEHRWRAAGDKGLTALPCVVIDCDDDTARRIMLGDNAYARMGAWDTGKLTGLLTQVNGEPRGLAGTGITDGQLAELLTGDRRNRDGGDMLETLAAVTLAEPTRKAEHGQAWRLGPHVLAVEHVATGWPAWIGYLTDGAVLLAHASALAPLSDLAQSTPLVMVQPDVTIAAYALDLWAAFHDEPVAA